MLAEARPGRPLFPAGAVPDGRDPSVLADVGRASADGQALRRWWEQKDAAGDYEEQFELARAFNRPDRAFGFFDHAPLSGRSVPVMGAVQEMFFDRPKRTAAAQFCAELREFVLHYFMRVSDFRQPETWAEGAPNPPETYLPGLSWCPRHTVRRAGFGYSQLFYKPRGAGAAAAFPLGQAYAIVDLREIGPKYDWVVGKVCLFDFEVRFRPLGADALAFVVPLREANYFLLAPEFITDRAAPAPGALGEYGFGYALLRSPGPPGPLAYGPGRFETGFQLFNFRVLDGGESRARLVFVVNRPQRILNVPLDPLGWTFRLTDLFSLGLASRFLGPLQSALGRLPLRVNNFDPVTTYIRLANLVTGGAAATQWCVSADQLDRYFLVQHFMQNYQMITGALLTWRHVPDWLDAAALPREVVTGVSS